MSAAGNSENDLKDVFLKSAGKSLAKKEKEAHPMRNLNETTRKSLEKAAQLEHRRQLKQYAEKKREDKRQKVLIFKLGEVVAECWPCVSRFTVRRTKAENEAEFAPLRELLLKIVSDTNYTILIDKISSCKKN